MELSYYYAYTEKQMAMKDIYGDNSVSYHNLYSYMNQLVESNPNSYVVRKNTPTYKGSCVYFYLLVLVLSGLTTIILSIF